MNKPKEFSGRHPLGFAFLSILLLSVLMGGASVSVTSFGTYEIMDVESQVVGQIVAIIGFLLLLWRLEWLAATAISRLGSRYLWLVTAIILAYTGLSALFGFFGTLDVNLSLEKEMVPVLSHTTLAGVLEEIVFRGLILYLLVRSRLPLQPLVARA